MKSDTGSKPVTTGAQDSPRAQNTRPPNTDERDVGAVLRVAYQQAVDEKIPAEMLDLLSKLN